MKKIISCIALCFAVIVSGVGCQSTNSQLMLPRLNFSSNINITPPAEYYKQAYPFVIPQGCYTEFNVVYNFDGKLTAEKRNELEAKIASLKPAVISSNTNELVLSVPTMKIQSFTTDVNAIVPEFSPDVTAVNLTPVIKDISSTLSFNTTIIEGRVRYWNMQLNKKNYMEIYEKNEELINEVATTAKPQMEKLAELFNRAMSTNVTLKFTK